VAEQDFINSFETAAGRVADFGNRRWRLIIVLLIVAAIAWLAIDIVVWEGGIRISRDGERVGIVQRVSPSKGFIWTTFEFELAQYAGAGSHQGKQGQAAVFGPWVCNVAAGWSAGDRDTRLSQFVATVIAIRDGIYLPQLSAVPVTSATAASCVVVTWRSCNKSYPLFITTRQTRWPT